METLVWYQLIEHDNNLYGEPSYAKARHIAGLKDAVKEANPYRLKHIDAFLLSVWRYNLPELSTSKTVKEIHEIVNSLDFTSKSEQIACGMDVVDLGLRDYEILLVKIPDTFEPYRGSSQTSLATSDAFGINAGLDCAIDCNPSFEPDTIPLVLLNEAFAIFKARSEAAPSWRALECLEQFIPDAFERHGSEYQRRKQIQYLLRRLSEFGPHEQRVADLEFTADGNLPVTVMPAAIWVCEEGTEPGDTISLAISSYGKFLHNSFDHSHHYYNTNTRFPCILVIDVGLFLTFYGAMWDGERVRVEPLTHPFDLMTHRRERKARYAIASALDAFLDTVGNIQAHYKTIEAMVKVKPARIEHFTRINLGRSYPFVTSYQDNGQEVQLAYYERLSDEGLIFSATPSDIDSKACIVKFTQQYSVAAHNCLASRDWAPRLWKCIQVCGDWVAVIMDMSKYDPLSCMTLTEAEKQKVHRKVTKIVRTLHECGFVHGDIRRSNFMVDRDSLSSEEVRVHMIQFDWAGRVGEVVYPLELKPESARRPAGVGGGKLITEAHDIEMVSYLLP